MAGTDDRNTFRVERSIAISAPADRIYQEIVDFHRWTAWSPWEGLDPNLRRRYEGPDSGVGAIYAWEGTRKVGTGRMEIVNASAPTNLTINLDFLKPFKAHNQAHFSLAEGAGVTKVTWAMTGPKTLGTRIMSIFTSMDKLVGRDFEKGLAQLKSVAES
jgi:hypothetical protein